MNHFVCPSTLVVATLLTGACDALLAPNPNFGPDSDESETAQADSSDSDSDPGSFGEDMPDEPCSGIECQAPLVFEDLGDTYVDQLAPHQAFGSEPFLRVDTRKATYVRLPNLASITATAQLESLELTMYCIRAGGLVQVRVVSDPWDEATLTSTIASSIGSVPVATVETRVGDNVIELVDLLEPFQLGQASPSIMLRAVDQNVSVNQALECSSREGGLGPSFVVVTSR